MDISVPEEVFGEKWEATVVLYRYCSLFHKRVYCWCSEDMPYKAGGYIQIDIPDCEVNYEDIDITVHPEEHPDDANKFQLEWDKFKLWPLKMVNDEVTRAYSMASYPAEGRRIMLNVRVATPPDPSKILCAM